MPLNVQAVAQPQQLEFVIAELSGQETPGLVAKLRHALIDQRFIDDVVPVHACTLRRTGPDQPITLAHKLITASGTQVAEPVRGSGQHLPVTKNLTEVLVEPDTYHVSPEPILMIADLHGALAVCLHDEGRAVGGLLHLRFMGGSGRPSDVTDNTLTSVLVVLDRFKRAVLGNALPSEEIQARIIAHAL